jgi:hypothetical protein
MAQWAGNSQELRVEAGCSFGLSNEKQSTRLVFSNAQMTKEDLLQTIQETAAKNGGVPLGQERFGKETGITPHTWRGKYWLRWSDALIEAGFTPNRYGIKYDEDYVLEKLAELARKCKHFPIDAELTLARNVDSSFPVASVIYQLGSKVERVAKLREFALRNKSFLDISTLLPDPGKSSELEAPNKETPEEESSLGFVYMIRLGKHYKIGKTNAVPRRHREISLELPEKPNVIHYIRTDDPEGIERYWHGRFDKFRTNGEWFALGQKEIRIFKKRKFM